MLCCLIFRETEKIALGKLQIFTYYHFRWYWGIQTTELKNTARDSFDLMALLDMFNKSLLLPLPFQEKKHKNTMRLRQK